MKITFHFISLIFFGVHFHNSLGAVVPKATNIQNHPKISEENDNIQLATMQREIPAAVALPPIPTDPHQISSDEQHLPQIPVPNPEQQQSMNLPNETQQKDQIQSSEQNSNQGKLMDIINDLQLLQKINELKTLESNLRNTQTLATLARLPLPAYSPEQPINVFGAIQTSNLLSNGGLNQIVSTGPNTATIVPVGTMSTIEKLIGNLLVLGSTYLNNVPTYANQLIAAVGPTGVSIKPGIENGLVTDNIGTGILGTGTGILGTGTGILGTGTGILGTRPLGGLLGLLSILGYPGGVSLSGGNVIVSDGNTVVTGGIPVGSIGGVITSKPSIQQLLNALVTKFGVTTTVNGLRSLNAEKTEERDTYNEMNWMASIMVDGKMISEGVLISDQHVLTIATPLMNIDHKNIMIRLGQNDHCSVGESGANVTISSILANPLFNPQTKSHDLALLKLSKKVEDSKLLPICLPSLSSQYILKEVTIPTWKTLNEPLCKPKSLQMPLMTAEACTNLIDPMALLTGDKNCMSTKLGDENICHAMMGTPVQHMGKDGIMELLGLISNPTQCEKSNGVYFVRVQDHLPWLLDHIKEDTMCMRI